MKKRILVPILLCLVGCVRMHGSDAGALVDGGDPAQDAGEPDAGPLVADAGPDELDAGPLDSGLDAGEPDAGLLSYDAGSDAGSDAGPLVEPNELCSYHDERAAVYGCPPVECPTSGICNQERARRCLYDLEIQTYDCAGLARLWTNVCMAAFCAE